MADQIVNELGRNTTQCLMSYSWCPTASKYCMIHWESCLQSTARAVCPVPCQPVRIYSFSSWQVRRFAAGPVAFQAAYLDLAGIQQTGRGPLISFRTPYSRHCDSLHMHWSFCHATEAVPCFLRKRGNTDVDNDWRIGNNRLESLVDTEWWNKWKRDKPSDHSTYLRWHISVVSNLQTGLLNVAQNTLSIVEQAACRLNAEFCSDSLHHRHLKIVVYLSWNQLQISNHSCLLEQLEES